MNTHYEGLILSGMWEGIAGTIFIFIGDMTVDIRGWYVGVPLLIYSMSILIYFQNKIKIKDVIKNE